MDGPETLGQLVVVLPDEGAVFRWNYGLRYFVVMQRAPFKRTTFYKRHITGELKKMCLCAIRIIQRLGHRRPEKVWWTAKRIHHIRHDVFSNLQECPQLTERFGADVQSRHQGQQSESQATGRRIISTTTSRLSPTTNYSNGVGGPLVGR